MVKFTILQTAKAGTHRPLLSLEPVGGEPLMSVTSGQCDARPTSRKPSPPTGWYSGTKLYCFVTEAHVR